MADAKVSPEKNRPPVDSPSLIGGSLAATCRSLLRRVDQVLEHLGLSADQWYVFDLIVRHDGIAMNDMARTLAIPAPTLTKFVDRLVTKALVFRLADHEDRRRVLVHASRRGTEAHAGTLPLVREAELDFLGSLPLTGRQRDAFRASLTAVLP